MKEGLDVQSKSVRPWVWEYRYRFSGQEDMILDVAAELAANTDDDE
ncbi:hypothetical protein ACIQW7_27970 [Peribacillus simplex]